MIEALARATHAQTSSLVRSASARCCRFKAAWLVLVACGLAACGGGSGGGGGSSTPPPPPPANRAPVADAGIDVIAVVGETVVLDGAGSSDPDGDALTYSWTLVARPNGSNTALDGADTPTPTFVVDVPGTYTVELIVSDGAASSAPDTVRVLTANTPPAAHQIRYHGVFAPGSPDRARVVPRTRAAVAGECGEAFVTDRQRALALTWAQRLKRVFAIEIETCRRCGGRLRVIASIEAPTTIERILAHLSRDAEPVDPAYPGRAPPQGELSF